MRKSGERVVRGREEEATDKEQERSQINKDRPSSKRSTATCGVWDDGADWQRTLDLIAHKYGSESSRGTLPLAATSTPVTTALQPTSSSPSSLAPASSSSSSLPSRRHEDSRGEEEEEVDELEEREQYPLGEDQTRSEAEQPENEGPSFDPLDLTAIEAELRRHCTPAAPRFLTEHRVGSFNVLHMGHNRKDRKGDYFHEHSKS